MPSVCLSVCLLAMLQYVKATERIVTKILPPMYLCTRKKGLNFGSHPGIFEGLFKTLRDMAFLHNLAYISGESDRTLMKILSQMYPWTRKSLLNFGSNPDLQSGSGVRIRIRTPDPDHILLGGRMRSLTALVCALLGPSFELRIMRLRCGSFHGRKRGFDSQEFDGNGNVNK